MFSVRLLIAVAGVLLTSDTNQVRASFRLRLSSRNVNSEDCIRAAHKENEKALGLIPNLPFLHDAFKRGEINALSKAQADLEKLLSLRAENRLVTLTAALFWELSGQFAEGHFKAQTTCIKCTKASTYMQKAMAKIIAAIIKELADNKKNKIKGLTKGLIKEDGTIKAKVSEEDIYNMGWDVWDALDGKYLPH